MKLSFILILFFCLTSCVNTYEHSYSNFEELKKANLRLQSWFPKLIGPDCYNIKEMHTIGDAESYGKFSYLNTTRIESILNDTTNYKTITLGTFSKFLERFKDLKPPSWFLDKENRTDKLFYKHDATYFIHSKKEKTFYFAYTLK